MKLKDLINWEATVDNMQNKYEGQEDLKRVWAPTTIDDEKAKKEMSDWSMKQGDGQDIIYYSYANRDFTDLETEPRVLFMPQDEKACIDGDIIQKDGIYYMFYKTEGHGDGIKIAMTKNLTSNLWMEDPDYKQQTKQSVEGSCVFKLNNEDRYMFIYDVYRDKQFHFCETSDLNSFSQIDHQISMDFHPRHGTVISLTNEELDRLTEKWGMPEGL